MDPEVDSRPALFLRCAWFDSGYMQCVSLWVFIFVNWWIMDPEVDSRPALFLRCAWFDSGYMQCVSLRSISYS